MKTNIPIIKIYIYFVEDLYTMIPLQRIKHLETSMNSLKLQKWLVLQCKWWIRTIQSRKKMVKKTEYQNVMIYKVIFYAIALT